MADAEAVRRQLSEHGGRRRAALETADAELREIERVAREALAAGLTKIEIAELSGISRPTLDALLKR